MNRPEDTLPVPPGIKVKKDGRLADLLIVIFRQWTNEVEWYIVRTDANHIERWSLADVDTR